MSSRELSKADAVRWTAADTAVRKGIKTFVEVGRHLLAIRTNEWHLSEFVSWDAYLEDLGLEKSYASRLIKSAEVVENVKNARQPLPMGNAAPANERQARPLGKVNPEDQPRVWADACEQAKAEGMDAPAARHVEEAVDRATSSNGKKPTQKELFAIERKRLEKTMDAAMRCFDELERLIPSEPDENGTKIHKTALAACRRLIQIAKEWK